ATGAALALFALVYFSSACQPPELFARASRLATAALLLAAAGLGAAAVAVSRRRRELAIGALCLASGFAVGNVPQWRARLFFGVPASTNINPSCPDGAPSRAGYIVREIGPLMWGVPPLRVLRELETGAAILWGLA